MEIRKKHKVILGYIKEPANLKPCEGCGELIYGNVFRLYAMTNKKKIKTEIILCESCFQL